MSSKTITTELPEQTKGRNLSDTRLHVTYKLGWGYLLSLLIMVLMGVTAVAGILFPNDIYPTAELQQTFVANDVVTLFIGLPILLIALLLTRRGKLLGLLFWPGALFYGLYNYFVYLFGVPFNVLYPLYLLIVTMSIYTTIALVAAIDGELVKQQLTGHVPERLASGVLIGLGVLFMLRVIGEMVGAIANQTPIVGAELGLLVADFIVCGAWVIGGVLLWRHQALGYVGGTGLLFQASMLFIGLICFLLLQPFLSDIEFVLVDVIVVFVMGLICFIPFALIVRGVVKA